MKGNVAGNQHRVRVLSSDFFRQPLPRPGIRGPRIRWVREPHVSVNQNAQFLLRANSRDDEGRLVRMIERADLSVPRHTKGQKRREDRQRKCRSSAIAAACASCSHSSADEVDDLKPVPAEDASGCPLAPAHDLAVPFHGDAVCLHLQRRDQAVHSGLLRIKAYLARLAVEDDLHAPRVSAVLHSKSLPSGLRPAKETANYTMVERRHHRAGEVDLAIGGHQHSQRFHARIRAPDG